MRRTVRSPLSGRNGFALKRERWLAPGVYFARRVQSASASIDRRADCEVKRFTHNFAMKTRNDIPFIHGIKSKLYFDRIKKIEK